MLYSQRIRLSGFSILAEIILMQKIPFNDLSIYDACLKGSGYVMIFETKDEWLAELASAPKASIANEAKLEIVVFEQAALTKDEELYDWNETRKIRAKTEKEILRKKVDYVVIRVLLILFLVFVLGSIFLELATWFADYSYREPSICDSKSPDYNPDPDIQIACTRELMKRIERRSR